MTKFSTGEKEAHVGDDVYPAGPSLTRSTS
jgi:hypothetical protein